MVFEDSIRAPETLKTRLRPFFYEAAVPTICVFYGITITMYWDDHAPPHFHAHYSGDEALVAIQTLSVLSGKLPRRALHLTLEWAAAHQEELAVVWTQCRSKQPPMKIEPLS